MTDTTAENMDLLAALLADSDAEDRRLAATLRAEAARRRENAQAADED